jgi:cytoskeleton protein RodZ
MDGDLDIGLDGSADNLDDGLSGPALVGAELRQAREGLGWALGDIAARLKIRAAFLEAIEAGDLTALPAPAYAAGFIRSYAEALGLDPEEILRRFRAEGMTRTRTPMLAFPEAVPDRGVPPGAIAILVAVIAIGGYVIWYGQSEHRRQAADAVPPIPTKFAPLALPKPSPVKTAKQAAPPSKASHLPAPPFQTAAHPVVTPAPSGAASIAAPAGSTKSGITATSLPPPVKLVVPGATTPDAAAPSPPAPRSSSAHPPPAPASAAVAPPAPPAVSAQPDNIVLIATARSWVEIRNVRGKILFSRVMEPGESWPLPDEPGLTLTTGNAGGTELIRNGVPGPPLGPPGSVVHSALITPSGTIVPPPPPVRVRHFIRRPPPRHHYANPFAVSIRGEQ